MTNELRNSSIRSISSSSAKADLRSVPWRWVIGVAVVVSSAAATFYYFEHKATQTEKIRIKQKREALTKSVSPSYESIKRKVEQWALEAAKETQIADFIDPEIHRIAWRELPTLYVRTRLGDAQNQERFYAAAKMGVLDGLLSCLLLNVHNQGPWLYGEVVARAEMLGADFFKEVRETSHNFRLQNLSLALESYEKSDFQVLREATQHSKHVVLALDEDTAAAGTAPATFDNTYTRHLQSMHHPIRLYMYRIEDSRLLIRVRRTPNLNAVHAQGELALPAETRMQQNTQALSCAMAHEAIKLVGGPNQPALPTMLQTGPSSVIEPTSPAPSISTSLIHTKP